MPRLAVYKFLTFYIFAYDAINEPPHLHIAKEKGNRQRSAKIWLGNLKFVDKGSLNQRELNLVQKLVKENQQLLLEQFDQVKRGNQIKTIRLG